MALATYSDLQTAVADYLNRGDLATVIPNFITLAEAKFNRKIRVIDMETRANGTISTEFASVPTDWLETRSLKLQIGTAGWTPNLEYIGEEEMAAYKQGMPCGYSRFYTIVNGAFDIYPAPGTGTVFELNYYAQIPALAAANTNWLLTKSPDLYLYGSLLEAEAYLKDDDRLPVWAQAWQSTLDDMALQSERAKTNRIQLNVRRRSFG